MQNGKKHIWASTLLIATSLCLLILSPRFDSDIPLIEKPVFLMVAILLVAGLVYFYVFTSLKPIEPTKRQFLWIFGTGMAMRLLLFPSVPMLEDDFYRYLWDGAVVSQGLNPYEFSPLDAKQSGAMPGETGTEYSLLIGQAPEVFNRINHPHLSTIYPPVAQAAFGLSYLIKPWSLIAWKTVLLLFDLLSLTLIVLILKEAGISIWGVGIYWLNPLLIKEIYNSAHMDIIIIPFVLGALFLSIRKKIVSATAFLALATGVKLWPAVLLPVILRERSQSISSVTKAFFLFVILSCAINLPLIQSWFNSGSGFAAYFKSWEMNDGIFMLLLWIFNSGILPGNLGEMGARLLAVIILGACIVWWNRSSWLLPVEMFKKCLYIVALMFMLSPTQFPWYYIWVIVFLAVNYKKSLLLLTPLLAIYYSRFYFLAIHQEDVFDYLIVWLEYLPVLILMAWEWQSERKNRS